MPTVTIDPSEYTHNDLKSAPPDGFVMLRPLPYGMKLARRDKALKMRMVSQQARKGQPQSNEQVIDLETLNEWATMYDFNYCIGDHNLQDKNGVLLNFNDPKQIEMVFKTLDPKVGSEIEDLLNKLNEDEDTEMLDDFLQRRGSSSETELSTLSMDSSDQ